MMTMYYTTIAIVYVLCASSVFAQENQAPQWIQTLKARLEDEGVVENTQVGSVIGTLIARDPEGESVIYSTNSEHFDVNQSTGVVTLRIELDREATTQIPIIFYAEDGAANKVPTSYTVKVIDANDNVPRFEGVPYSAKVQENEEIGRVVFSGITVRDVDRGINSQLTLSCYVPENDNVAFQSCQKFSIREVMVSEGLYKGEITLDQTLNYEAKRKYIMTVKARDKGEPQLATTVNVVIEVGDVQDSPPQFLNAPLSLDVYENTPKDASVGEIIAQDQDTGVPNLLRLQIVSPEPPHKFYLGTVNVTQGRIHRTPILSSGLIDRDDFGEIYQFTVEAVELINGKDSAVRAQTSVTVTIRDRNDNGPFFDNTEYSLTVNEGIIAPNQIPDFAMIVKDNDSGQNAQFRITIIDDGSSIGGVPLASVYKPIPDMGTQFAEVALAVVRDGFLDYEVPAYRRQRITVLAQETDTPERRSSTATVFITLKDVNDNVPKFSRIAYTEFVREDRPVGHVVTTLTATDADSPPLSDITYSLSGTLANKFSVGERSGIISLAEQLDYESTARIELVLSATDGGGARTSVALHINVLDFNDIGPVFDSDQYRAFVSESSTALDPNITVHAVDADSDGIVFYRIIRGNTRDEAFRIGNITGHLELTRRLSFGETPNRQGFFELTIEGSDRGNPVAQTSTVPVIVTVRDENDNSPQFGAGSYTGQVTEISPPGFSVVTVSATDEDDGNNAKINYVLQSGGRDNFAINPISGVISVAPEADLDIEKFGNEYNIIVNAVDMGSPQRTATAQVIVSVLDANNQKPTFAQDVYVFSVKEDEASGYKVATLTASDIDANSLLEYMILPDSAQIKDKSGNAVTQDMLEKYKGAFRVGTSSGDIRVAKALNRDEAAEVSFTVQARDLRGETADQTTTALVVISIRSSGDDGLEFVGPWTPEKPEFTVTVPEEQAQGTIITQVVAQDPNTRKAIDDYREVLGSDPNNYFSVDRQTGRVRLLQTFDYETMPVKELSFQIEAFTPPPSVRSAMATVIVKVLDINDNSPVFLQREYQFSISESTRYPTQFAIIKASDKDSGPYGEVRYSLSGQGASNFYLDPSTGYLYVSPNATLDRETIGKYNLLVTATDNPSGTGPKQISSVSLTITLQDENDNVPQFTNDPYTMYVLENTPAQTSLGGVSAIDKDSDNNGRVTYSIRSGNDDNLFIIDSTTGIIRSRVDLTGSARDPPYILTVRGQDNGSPPRFSDVTVEVFIEDAQSQDGKPRFRFPGKDGEVVEVDEEIPPGTNITQVIGIDRNPDDNRQLRYGFVASDALAGDHSKFHIDPDTGLITSKGRLDREKKSLYELLLLVSDGNQEVTRRLYINLTDINDHTPAFGSCPGEVLVDPQIAYVKEEEPASVYVTTVKACDEDQPPNNVLYYFIACGNDPLPQYNNKSPFRIDKSSGEIFTMVSLDHEKNTQFTLCAVVSNFPEVNVTIEDIPTETTTVNPSDAGGTGSVSGSTTTNKKITVYGGDLLKVVVNVEDVDDNGPNFGGSTDGQTQTTITTGVLATSRIGTEVVTLYATDPDAGIKSNTKYTLNKLVFYGPNNAYTQVDQEAFKVNTNTGVVTTNLVNYLDFVDGYFQMTAQAEDEKGRKSQAQLYIYVVRNSQSLRFIFKQPPDETKDNYQEFMRQLQYYFTGTDLNVDSLRYHALGEGRVDYDRSDLCFHMVKDKKVVNTDQGLQMFDDQKENTELQSLFYRYSVEEVNVCEVKITTRWWSGRWFLWWILIGLALFIFVTALILACCLCYCWDRFQKKTYYRAKPRPYVVLDPVGIPNGTIGSDYEWQQEVVKMD